MNPKPTLIDYLPPTEKFPPSVEDAQRDDKLKALHDQLIGLQIKQGISDSWRMDWLEMHPQQLKGMQYRGRTVWFVDAIEDFPTAREAIDYAIKQLPIAVAT